MYQSALIGYIGFLMIPSQLTPSKKGRRQLHIREEMRLSKVCPPNRSIERYQVQ